MEGEERGLTDRDGANDEANEVTAGLGEGSLVDSCEEPPPGGFEGNTHFADKCVEQRTGSVLEDLECIAELGEGSLVDCCVEPPCAIADIGRIRFVLGELALDCAGVDSVLRMRPRKAPADCGRSGLRTALSGSLSGGIDLPRFVVLLRTSPGSLGR